MAGTFLIFFYIMNFVLLTTLCLCGCIFFVWKRFFKKEEELFFEKEPLALFKADYKNWHEWCDENRPQLTHTQKLNFAERNGFATFMQLGRLYVQQADNTRSISKTLFQTNAFILGIAAIVFIYLGWNNWQITMIKSVQKERWQDASAMHSSITVAARDLRQVRAISEELIGETPKLFSQIKKELAEMKTEVVEMKTNSAFLKNEFKSQVIRINLKLDSLEESAERLIGGNIRIYEELTQ